MFHATSDSVHKVTRWDHDDGGASGLTADGRGGMELYTPVLVLAALAALFAVGSVVMSTMVGPRRYNRAKVDSYECGIEPTPQALSGRVPVKYYTVAMTFIIFDIEIVFLYPWAVAFDELGWFGFLAVLLFLFNITVAYVYEWRRGGLDWD